MEEAANNVIYLNRRSNLALPLSWSLFVHFPRLFLTIIIDLIVLGQFVSSLFQNIFQEMCVNRVGKALIKPEENNMLVYGHIQLGTLHQKCHPLHFDAERK